MEVTTTSFGEKTKRAISQIPHTGLSTGVKNEMRLMPVSEVIMAVDDFMMGHRGILTLPSGNKDGLGLRNAVISDLIDETKKDKLQSSLSFLKDTAAANRGREVSMNYDPHTGQVSDFELTPLEKIISKFRKTNTIRDKEWTKGVSLSNCEVVFADDGQIKEVTFQANPVDNKSKGLILSEGLTKSQIKVMTVIAEHNKRTATTNFETPMPDIKRDHERLGKLVGSELFWEATKTK